MKPRTGGQKIRGISVPLLSNYGDNAVIALPRTNSRVSEGAKKTLVSENCQHLSTLVSADSRTTATSSGNQLLSGTNIDVIDPDGERMSNTNEIFDSYPIEFQTKCIHKFQQN